MYSPLAFELQVFQKPNGTIDAIIMPDFEEVPINTGLKRK